MTACTRRTVTGPVVTAPVVAVRLAWGGYLLAAPGHRLPVPVPALRVLGARHLGEATAQLVHPTDRVLTVTAALDGLHAVSMLLLATLDRRRRRICLLDAAVAGAFCLSTLRSRPRPWSTG